MKIKKTNLCVIADNRQKSSQGAVQKKPCNKTSWTQMRFCLFSWICWNYEYREWLR